MKFQIIFLYVFFLLANLLLFSCKENPPTNVVPYTSEKSVFADSAMVVAPHPLASKVGVEILKQGGNAVDATIAIQFALAVVYPRAGNIGGGGFMVLRQTDGSTAALDYREKAPLAADRDMYLDSVGNVIKGLSRHGHLAVGVPGTVAGMFAAHKRYGKIKDIKTLIAPAIELAHGFPLSAREAERLNQTQEAFKQYNTSPNAFMNEIPWKAGDILKQPDLAATLQRIHDQGQAGFYEGKTADLFVAEMEAGNGIITHEDLKRYEAKWRTPIEIGYKNYKVISMPPPSSGGVALAQLLKLSEPYPLAEYGFHSPEAIHLMAEIERRVYADRAKHLGDSDFHSVPLDTLLDDTYLSNRMLSFSQKSATSSDSVMAGNVSIALESFETTHTSVIDAMGNATSVTTTLNSSYGSKVVVTGGGFFLNNEMDDFSAKPGVPNQFGLVGAEANAVVPEKRMLSSMTPTIIEKEGKLFMVIGAPGGSTIITAVYQVFMNVAEFGMSLEEAVNASRFHHQWLPDKIMIEKEGFDMATQEALLAKGHNFREVKYMAVVKAIEVTEDGQLNGVGDKRNPDDDAKGY